MYAINATPLEKKHLSRMDIIDLILLRFYKGAKCFNGDWWGCSTEVVEGSPYGYDVRVYLKQSSEHKYYGIAYGYKDDKRDIDFDHILIDELRLEFWIDVLQSSLSEWGYKIYNSENQIISEQSGYPTENEVHRAAVDGYRVLSERKCPLLFKGGVLG